MSLLAALWGLGIGFKDGFFKELFRVATYGVSLTAAWLFCDSLGQYLTLHTFLKESVARVIAFVVLLAGTLLGGKILCAILQKLLKTDHGGPASRLLGAALGVVRLIVLLSFFFMLIDWLPIAGLKTDLHQRSLSGPAISRIAPLALEFASQVAPDLGAIGKRVAG